MLNYRHKTGLQLGLLLALVLLLIFLPFSCTYDVQTPNPCFKEEVLPVFISKCAYSGCHDGGSGSEDFALNTYEGIMKGIKPGHPFQSELYNQISGGEMPPAEHPQLSKTEKSLIKYWIKSGAPNSSNCITCDSAFTFGARIQPLMNKWCVSCHNSANKSGGFDLSDYTGIVKAVNTNRLLGSMQQAAGYVAMPQGSSRLSDCDLLAVSRWIGAGHPNN